MIQLDRVNWSDWLKQLFQCRNLWSNCDLNFTPIMLFVPFLVQQLLELQCGGSDWTFIQLRFSCLHLHRLVVLEDGQECCGRMTMWWPCRSYMQWQYSTSRQEMAMRSHSSLDAWISAWLDKLNIYCRHTQVQEKMSLVPVKPHWFWPEDHLCHQSYLYDLPKWKCRQSDPLSSC